MKKIYKVIENIHYSKVKNIHRSSCQSVTDSFTRSRFLVRLKANSRVTGLCASVVWSEKERIVEQSVNLAMLLE